MSNAGVSVATGNGNPFDQWDAPPAAPAANPFDKFDAAPAKVVAAQAPNNNGAPSIGASAIDAARSVPGGLAKGVAAVAGLGGDIRDGLTDAVRFVGNKVSPGAGDTSAPFFDKDLRSIPGMQLDSQEISDILSRPSGGYYVPKTSAGQYAETIASFAPAAFGGEASIPARVARVVVPAVSSQFAGDETAGTPFEPVARVGGALLGGGALASGPTVIRSINKLGSFLTGSDGFLDPSVEAASKIKTAFDKDGGVAAATPKLQSFGDSGSSNPSLIDVSGNNVMRLVRAAAAGDGPAQNAALSYADRVRANLQDNVTNRAMQLTPQTPQTASDYAAKLQSDQSDQAAANYAGPYSQPAAVTPDMVSALQGPEGRGAISRAYAAARANRNVQQMGELQDLLTVAQLQGGGRDALTGQLQSIDTALSNLSAGSLDRVRIAMRETGNALYQKGANDIARGYSGRVSDIDTALDQTPGLLDARTAYRGSQAQIDAVPLGQSALNLPSNQYADQVAELAQLSPDARTAAAVGHRQAIIDAVQRPAQGQTGILNRLGTSTQQTDNLATSFGDPAASAFQTAVNNEVGRLRNATAITPNAGSQTQLRGADTALVNIPDVPRSATGLVLTLVNKIRAGATLTPAERAEIVRIGTSEADLRALAAQPTRFPSGAQIALPTAIATGQPGYSPN